MNRLGMLGTIAKIYRYPVKSFQGELIADAIIHSHGMVGDRTHVFTDLSGNDHLSAKQKPQLLAYSASWVGDDIGNAELQVRSPEGDILYWDEELLKEVSERTNLDLSLRNYSHDHEGLTAVDAEPLLIATEESLSRLEASYGQSLDFRRFRPNLVIKMDEELDSFDENDWIGKTIAIGDAELEITQKCYRCSMVNVNPDDMHRDPALLKYIVRELEGCYGIYAAVRKPGKISTRDKVFLCEEGER